MSDDTLLDVLIIGAGLGGVGTAAQLIESGYDNIAVIEAADSVGGVWRQHRYPNIACDTPIDLYAYSFYPGTSWSTNFAPGSEILAYLRDLADRYGVTRKTVFNTRISQATWNDDAGCWRVTSRDGRTWAARMLIWSGGLLSQPTLPEIKGLDGFEGQSIHTSFWNDDIDLDGKRVAVVGGGATSIQVVPYAAKHAEKLYVFVRTPSYVMPRPDISFADIDRDSEEFASQQLERRKEWFDRFEVIAKSRFPMNGAVIAEQEAAWRKLFDEQVKDPHAREVLAPKYRFGCKRPLFSTDYYPAFERDNVELIGRGVSGLSEDAIVDVDGERYPVDVVIWATGFDPAGMMGDLTITGSQGRVLAQEWQEVPHAYFGSMVEGFPNFFMICGPNGGGASVTDMVEAQTRFILDAMKQAEDRGADILEVDEAAYAAFNDDIQARADASVLVQGNCVSYYRVGGTGKVFTHWPDTIEAFRNRVKKEALSGVRFRASDSAGPASV
ncbi:MULTISPECIES: flavin-containing monooxygenase [Maritimibacter]|jgi:cation diffusion facilitator CzcD-associated flavoprotein CzcO|uniref:Probable flavin-binding monooxygenase n=1 Tax=Maritimibacter alkaliphilus HTCC2654 TaxID=314271 RepID=A3VIT4_9RHOB|nr:MULTISPECIES: NAD(P)/FAD-dependent oxidoreductase [Maritimibacter]EAQ11778.1 probable flavin-binding monooxygenase [Rhodobacterales bacterium HTCC2654] [Maritimibacter alkaliphilus HTCC2654]MAM61364.1 NAD(P)/FAD-dependent oxidoreductase [Maritimibacter sp.]MBL6430136.1 NAD(P)/FAD-dependent oxidoreductase [Maritimibacter sp.]TYP78459.1 cation diffusion facilitator CzcD-associated flavoprotein CzcO [Maritimibacter alkaliphilus HTCC2654]|tara:strand:+ start:6995 stop:8485 length:1491 start_codon:yes stop_codon:yes gene_type:complete